MKVALLLPALLALSACSVQAGPLKEAQRSYLSITDVFGDFRCGATKIDDHTAVTAEHCVDDAFLLQGQVPSDIIMDGNEHALVIVDKELPGKAAKLAHRYPTYGEEIFIWGKPMGFGPLWRHGDIAGYVTFPEDPSLAHLGTFTIANLFVAPGDSGSGIYNADGKLVGTVSIGLMVMFRDWAPVGYVPYKFTVEQWKQVK